MLQGPEGQQCQVSRHSSQPVSKCLILPQPKTRATLSSDTCKASCHSELCDSLPPSLIQIQNPWRAWVQLNMTMLFTTSPAISTASQTTTFRPSTSDSSSFGCEPSFPQDVLVSPVPQSLPQFCMSFQFAISSSPLYAHITMAEHN